MRAVRSLVVAALAFVVFAAPTVVLADGRVALVVGNSTYAYIGRLPNPDNDAHDISAAARMWQDPLHPVQSHWNAILWPAVFLSERRDGASAG